MMGWDLCLASIGLLKSGIGEQRGSKFVRMGHVAHFTHFGEIRLMNA